MYKMGDGRWVFIAYKMLEHDQRWRLRLGLRPAIWKGALTNE